MNKTSKNGLLPKLRFPEFEDAWKVKKLGDFSEIVRGGSPRPIDEYITTETTGLNWLKIADVDKNSKYVISTKEKVLSSALKNTRQVNPGDLIMSNSMSFGRPYILKIKSCIHDGWIAVTQIAQEASRDYLYYLILCPNSQEYFINNAAGSGVQNLNVDIIKLLQVPIPNYLEQQKIASCLSSVDELIHAQTQKLEALKTHKKGLMQQLFPREGETIPRLRFPEFQDAGEWVVKSLGSICDYSNGASHEGDVIEGGEYFLISLNSLDINGNLKSDMKRLSKTDYSLEKNDLVMVLSDVAHGNFLGLTDIIFSNKFVLNQRMARLRLKEVDLMNVNFLRIFINKSQKYFKKRGQGSSQLNLAKSAVIDFPVFLPGIKEQQKIASCLSSIDELIHAHTQKLEVLKTHKKGLMQQLFPHVKAVCE